MPQMKFNTRVKYGGRYIAALMPFEVDGADVAELQKRGGVLIVDSTAKKPEEKKPEEKPKATEERPGASEEKPKRGKKKAAAD